MGVHLHLRAQYDVWNIGRVAARMSAKGRELPQTGTFGIGSRRCQGVLCMCVVVVLVSSTHQTTPDPCCSVGGMLLSCCHHGVMMSCCSLFGLLLSWCVVVVLFLFCCLVLSCPKQALLALGLGGVKVCCVCVLLLSWCLRLIKLHLTLVVL